MKDIVLKSTLTCPECGYTRTDAMPTDQCVWYWQCPGCATLLRPKPGDCCIYCSFGDLPCPPVQQQGKGGCCTSSSTESES